MYCKNCGKQIINGSAFCKYCGTQLSSKKSNISKQSTNINAKSILAKNSDTSLNDTNNSNLQKAKFKCKNCGEVLKSFQSICPSCGLEIRGINSIDSIQELHNAIISVDAEPFPKNFSLFPSRREEFRIEEEDRRTQRKENIIKSFPIPNTKEDITEFLIYATSQMEDIELGDAWESKFNQAIEKAEIMFPDSPEIQKFLNKYENIKISKRITKRNKSFESNWPFILLFAMGAISIIFMYLGS